MKLKSALLSELTICDLRLNAYLNWDFMVVTAAVFIRDQPTFVEISGDTNSTGDFCLIFVAQACDKQL